MSRPPIPESPSASWQQRLRNTVVSPEMARGVGLAVFLALAAMAEVLIRAEGGESSARERLESLSRASTLRARIERELNSVLFLSSGLSSYLVVRHRQLDPVELGQILAALHGQSRHVRNFAIAVGYRVEHVYPLASNEKAVGIDYRSLPSQWPLVKQAVDSGRGTLAGPLSLVQGGSGLIYRQPVYVDGQYWGLLSTVIDADSFFRSAIGDLDVSNQEFAIRGRDGLGADGPPILGDPALFDDPATIRVDMDVPSGKWALAMRNGHGSQQHALIWVIRALSWLVAALLGTATYSVLNHRIELARLAMFDSLTELPNRRLLDDRLKQAIHRHARRDDNHCAVIFIDLDRFKEINDQHGHAAGDLVLKTVARRLRDEVRLSDTVARWGGDEMVVVVEQAERARIDALVGRLRQAIASPLEIGDLRLQLEASIGTALYPDEAPGPAELLALADQRMYEEKLRRQEAAAPA